MKLTSPQVISELRSKQPSTIGRHLYAVLGTYQQLEQFEQDLAAASDHKGQPFPVPINLNRCLLDNIADDKLRQLVRDEPNYPSTVRKSLQEALQTVLANELQRLPLLIVKQVELLFAFKLDLGAFRTDATNQNHILLLLPGEQRSSSVVLFHEAEDRFQHFLPGSLIADNHLWELIDA